MNLFHVIPQEMFTPKDFVVKFFEKSFEKRDTALAAGRNFTVALVTSSYVENQFSPALLQNRIGRVAIVLLHAGAPE